MLPYFVTFRDDPVRPDPVRPDRICPDPVWKLSTPAPLPGRFSFAAVCYAGIWELCWNMFVFCNVQINT